MEMDREQQIQARQYEFPYHYIPGNGRGNFTQTRHWSWGFRYLGGLRVALELLEGRDFEALLDVGCGDGRFLREAARHYPEARLLGVDYSERAIALARAMNPGLDYRALNILEERPDGRFGAATAIEVLEHIPPDDLPAFAGAIADCLEPGGHFACTVPHRNKAVSAKHYQHFDSEKLRGVLEPHFEEITLVPFDHRSRLLWALSLLLGGSGRHMVVTNRRINNWFYRLYRRRWLYVPDEKQCLRIAAVCRRKP